MPPPPEPRFNCTIPTIHDDIPLSVRIYHPSVLARPQSSGVGGETQWKKRGIVMAHPYAPMGGNYDDRVVGIVVDEFLKAGWVVGTFNFRGATGSKGRTSWSGKPELDDYLSFAAFFMHYMSYLRPFPIADTMFAAEQPPVSSRVQKTGETLADAVEGSCEVVLGGYSYGSLILRHLPPVPSILQTFASPLTGSSADEILLRAHKLTDQANLEWFNQARDRVRQRQKGHDHNLLVTMGGEETSPEKRRTSRDIRRSVDRRRSLDLGGRLRSLSHRRRNGTYPQTLPESTPRATITVPTVRYLLISPLMPPLSALAAPALANKFWNRSSTGAYNDVLAKHETLVIYGDQDVFSSAKKDREWKDRLQRESGTRFWGVEVPGAGHFWHEQGVERELRLAFVKWERRGREGTTQ